MGAATAAFGAEASIWAAPIAARGAEIEQRLGANLPSNFPTIDKFVNGVATSIKSLDLGAKTYQSGGVLLSTLNGYVDKLAAFGGRTWAGVTVQGSEIGQRVLQLAIPQGGMTSAQRAAFDAATARAVELGVTIQTTVVK